MEPPARPPALRGATLRLGLLTLLLLGQPGGICSALCALAHRADLAPVSAHHHGSPEPDGPCHGAGATQALHDQLSALVLAFTPAASAGEARALPDGPPPPAAGMPHSTRQPVPDPPPPRA